MRVLVVSGFLGAGKTTFIEELARRTGRDFVVYENEYGQADLDADKLRTDAELEVWVSAENCICCTGKQDFASSVLTISNTLDPEFLVVEPTGVAKLSAIMANLRQVASGYDRIELLAPVCICDSHAWARQREQMPDVFDDQLAQAATIVLSKITDVGIGKNNNEDLIPSDLSEVAPHAHFVARRYDELPDTWWKQLLACAIDEQGVLRQLSSETEEGENEPLDRFAFSHANLPTPGHLAWMLDALVSGVFGNVVRAKGIVCCGNQNVRFDCVDRAWAMTGADEAEDPRAVFIGTDIHRPWLREAFVPAFHRNESDINDACHHGEHEICEHEEHVRA